MCEGPDVGPRFAEDQSLIMKKRKGNGLLGFERETSSDISPGRSGQLHGMSYPESRTSPDIVQNSKL